MTQLTRTKWGMTSPEDDPWAHIPPAQVEGKFRLAPLNAVLPAPGASLHRGRDHANHRMFVLRLDPGVRAPLRQPPMAGIELTQIPAESGGTMLMLRLLASEHDGPFRVLCDDITSEVSRAPDAAAARDRFIARTRAWQDLLRRAMSPLLSHEEQMGLIGELLVLTDLLAPLIGAAAAVRSWTGPGGAPKDFEAGDVWIEAKAFGAARRRQIRITSEAQLDDLGSSALFLHVTPLNFAVPAAQGGLTLPEWVSRARSKIAGDDPSCLGDFDATLTALGFDAQHQYDDLWTAGEPAVYRVGEGFPRILRSNYPDGPLNVAYDLPLSALEPWRSSRGAVAEALRAAGGAS